MIEIKDARIEDCGFIARCVCIALHKSLEASLLQCLEKICQREDVLYSYRHAIIAWEGDTPVGLCLCYDGGRYHEMRETTFPLFDTLKSDNPNSNNIEPVGQIVTENAEDEAVAGEYYIDSIAVLPEYRKQSIGGRLLQAQIDKASALDFKKVTLLVDPENYEAQSMYRRHGFIDDSEVFAFGQIYLKWKLMID